MTTTVAENLLLTAAEVAIEAGATKRQPKISIVAYSGGVMRVPGWGDVAIDLDGLDASGQVPLLADHKATVSGAVGHGEARVVDGRLIVTGVMSGAGEAARQIVEMTTGGFTFQASVGVEPVEPRPSLRREPGDRRLFKGEVMGRLGQDAVSTEQAQQLQISWPHILMAGR